MIDAVSSTMNVEQTMLQINQLFERLGHEPRYEQPNSISHASGVSIFWVSVVSYARIGCPSEAILGDAIVKSLIIKDNTASEILMWIIKYFYLGNTKMQISLF